MKKNIIITILGLIMMSLILFYVFGSVNEGMYSVAEVTSVVPAPSDEVSDGDKSYDVQVYHTSGPRKGKTTDFRHYENETMPSYNIELHKGDKVLMVIDEMDDQTIVGVDEHFKSYKLMGLSIFLLVVITAISGVNGVKAMLALFVTLILIFGALVPGILKGHSPITLTIAASAVIIVLNIFIIAGKTKKALIAGLGCLSGVIMAGVFGHLTTIYLKLSGYSGDESCYIQTLGSKVDLKDILVCGIIIGALGAVMDVAISIASSLKEISEANPEYKTKDLFKSGMNIGRDIIGSMVNTLILAYTGSSLTLILVLAMQQEDFPLIKIMNMDSLCTEIVRSLAGLFGMVLSIPITAFTASIIYLRGKKKVI